MMRLMASQGLRGPLATVDATIGAKDRMITAPSNTCERRRTSAPWATFLNVLEPVTRSGKAAGTGNDALKPPLKVTPHPWLPLLILPGLQGPLSAGHAPEHCPPSDLSPSPALVQTALGYSKLLFQASASSILSLLGTGLPPRCRVPVMASLNLSVEAGAEGRPLPLGKPRACIFFIQGWC